MPRPNVNGSRNSSRSIKDKLKAELEAETYEYNLKVAKYRYASLLEFCDSNDIDFDDVISYFGEQKKNPFKVRGPKEDSLINELDKYCGPSKFDIYTK